jgi:16S rRNA C967 or C1407 C5-methylase (RsmB/RsmF family)
MKATVRVDELALIMNEPAVGALWEAVGACAENWVGVLDFARQFVVSVNDPNPDKVHAVLDACAALGVVLG